MHRRDWIKKVGASSVAVMPGVLLGDSESSYQQVLRALVGNLTIKPDSRVELHVPQDAANGAVVPVGVVSTVPDTIKIVLLINNHSRAKVAELDTSNSMLAPRLSTHLQMTQTATIIALVQTTVGWHSNSTEVKTLGERC